MLSKGDDQSLESYTCSHVMKPLFSVHNHGRLCYTSLGYSISIWNNCNVTRPLNLKGSVTRPLNLEGWLNRNFPTVYNLLCYRSTCLRI